MTPPQCAHCPAPAVAIVTTTTARVLIRTDQMTNPHVTTARAADLRCWGHATAAVDAHLTGLTTAPTGDTR